MSCFRTSLLTCTALAGLAIAGAAAAQTTTPQPATQTPNQTQAQDQSTTSTNDQTTTVTVTGKKQQNRIDRQVYDNNQNIDSASGTASDALNKVPSVNVDPNGNLTLRGNSNVQVLVDGKPSAMMQGDNRAATLQSMSSGDIDSIEVMNNPGAQFGAEGTGGIINLVMKRNRRPGTSGAVIANVGDEGRYNGSVSIARNSGKMTLSGGANFRHDNRSGRGSSVVDHLDGNGNVVSHTESTSKNRNENQGGQVNAGIDYNINDTDSVGAQVAFAHREFQSSGLENYTASQFGAYTQASNGANIRNDNSFDVRWDHTGDQPAETLKVDLRMSSSAGKNENHVVSTAVLPGGISPDYTTNNESDTRNGVFSVDYNRNVGESGQLSTGWQTTYDDNHFLNTATGVVGYTSGASLNSDFAYKQILNAAYVTYQTPVGPKLTVMGGLRVEALDLTTRQFNTQSYGHIYYTKAVPSFFAAYTLSDTEKLRFSYSHRLQRPQAQDLNPSRIYLDSQNIVAGNPDLKPQETDSYELGYEVSKGTTSYQIRAYYRNNQNVITQLSSYLGNGVILTTRANEGQGHADGLEFNYNGKIGTKLSVSLNGNLAQTELRTPSTGKTDATSLSGRISFDYQASLKDRIQLMMFSSGKQLTGQGYRAPFQMANISYRHTITPKLSAVMTVNDPFRSGKFTMVTNSDTVHSTISRGFGGPSIFVGLTYLLGGAPGGGQQQNGPDGQGGWRGRGGGGWQGGGGGQWQGGGGGMGMGMGM